MNSTSLKNSFLKISVAALALGLAACASPEEKVAKYTKEGQEFLAEDKLGRANVQFKSALKIDEEHVPALVGIAEIAEKKNDYKAMFGVLQKVNRLQPENMDALIKLGQLYLIASDEAQALEFADKALALEPENASALGLKAGILLRLENTGEAVELAQKANAIDPANAEAVTVLATARVLAKEYEEALAILDEGLEVAPKSAVLHLLRMQILSSQGRADEVREAHRRLIAEFPEDVSYRRLYVTTLLNEERFADAREQLVEIAELMPRKVDPVLDVVRVDLRLGGPEQARETFKSYVEQRPENIDLKFAFASFLRQQDDAEGADAIYTAMLSSKEEETVLKAKNEIARLRLMEGDADEAKKLIAEILKEDARNPDALLKQAGLKINDGKFDEAILDLRTVLDNNPDSMPAKMLTATAFENKGDTEFAISQMAQAVEDSGNAAGPSNVFARLLLRADQPQRAERVLVDSLAEYPSDENNLKMLAAVRLLQQDWRGAEEVAQLLKEVDEEDPVIDRVLGAAYAGLKDYAGAIDVLKTSNEKSPLASRPLATLIAAYMESGREDEAEELLKSTIESSPDNYAAYLLLAEVHHVRQRPNEAKETLRQAIDQNPQRPEGYEALYRLYLTEGRRDDAQMLIEQGLERAPDNEGLRVLLADFHISGGEPEKALPIYEDILTRRPGDLLVSNNYASLLGELRDDPASRARAVEIASVLEGRDNGFFLDTLGWAQYRNGDVKNAIKNLERAVEFAPRLVEARYHLGVALMADGQTDRGRAMLLDVIETPGAPAEQVLEARRLLEENAVAASE